MRSRYRLCDRDGLVNNECVRTRTARGGGGYRLLSSPGVTRGAAWSRVVVDGHASVETVRAEELGSGSGGSTASSPSLGRQYWTPVPTGRGGWSVVRYIFLIICDG